MGLINEKEDPELILDLLNKNKSLLNKQNSNENSFKLIYKIIIYYEKLKALIKNEKNELLNNNNNYLTTKEINHQLNRIKKWINMAKTKDNLQRTAEKMQTSQFDEIISIQRKKTNNPNSKMLIKEKKESPNNKFKTMNSQKLNNNEFTINLYDYTDCKIERGIKNFYIKNYEKFLERVLKGPPDCFRLTSWLILNRIPLERKKDIYDFYFLKELNEEIKLSIEKDIQRSFHDNEITENLRPKEKNLYNVLKDFSNLDTNLGYCLLLNISDFNENEIFFINF